VNEFGEWFRDIEPDGNVSGNKTDDWKGPYNNSRTCMEVIRRMDSLGEK